jgi:formate hydrogenlyase subunit 3/multisubunit Na+/H+ antiporter MnhD subunit
MVANLLQPLNIFVIGLAGGFLIPLLYRIGKPLSRIGFLFSLVAIAVISASSLLRLLGGAPSFEVETSGALPPLSINLRLGLWEGFFSFAVNLIALLGAWHLWRRLRESYAAMLLYLILVMGINGMIMTRDLFNLFVFLEIVAIATYGLLALDHAPEAIAAGFKYVMATVIASSFFVLGTALLYYGTGILNIDELLANPQAITGPFAATGVLFVLACLLVELKPFPANGWGLDVYETAPGGIAALVSVGVSAGVFFALFKLLPLFENQLWLVALSAGGTFVISNLIGLRQTRVQRLLGYSSIAQMGLLVLALVLLTEIGATDAMPLVIGGLFVNHLLAKAGLFWFSGIIERAETGDWKGMRDRPFLLAVLAVLLAAIAGLPPFPGFWAKWELAMQLASGGKAAWIAVVLVGSLLEIAYMFRWFRVCLEPAGEDEFPEPAWPDRFPVAACAALLAASGIVAADLVGVASLWLFAPVLAGAALYILDRLAQPVQTIIMLVVTLLVGAWLVQDLEGIEKLFAAILLTGAIVIASAGLYRSDRRPGYQPLLAVLILSIAALTRARTNLEFFYCWEMVTLASYFLIARGRHANAHIQPYLMFSMASAFLLLAGFSIAANATGSNLIAELRGAGPDADAAIVLLALGFLIKAGAIGVHVWLPGAYGEADDDMSAMLSAVVSKVAIFGLFMGTYWVIASQSGLAIAHVLGWIGMLTAAIGALLALGQTDIKRMLAYSSMSQLGYIVTAIALMSHLGWVTALYLVANHLMVKGILFLAAAGIILRTGTRTLEEFGGLWRKMPLTAVTLAIALLAMSGLPPLMGFGGKWLLLSAMAEKQWYGSAILALLATFLGLLYIFRLALCLFLEPDNKRPIPSGEAPMALLLPQFLLVAGILVLSLNPKPLMEPVSQAIDPYFASTLVWEGMSLETIYGYWNPVPTMIGAVAVAAALFAAFWLYYRRQSASGVRRADTIYRYYQPVIGSITPPAASAFWDAVCASVRTASGAAARIYSGDGQTYALYVIYFTVALYLFGR